VDIVTLANSLANLDLLRWSSALCYAIFATGLLWLGFLHHRARVMGEKEVKQYPKGYFTFLSIQLIPLLVTGFVIGDVFVISTRLATLAVVAVVYAITTSEDGTFVTRRHIFWSFVMIAVAILLPLLWSDSEVVRGFVAVFEKWIAWGSVAVMLLFVWKGQMSVAQELFQHFVGGNYSVKRLRLQFVRFFGFFFQTIAYALVPSKAAPIFGLDPIMLQGAIGTMGVALVLLFALVGFIAGGSARREYKRQLAHSAWRA
jgi:hypothetical protein